MDSRLGPPSARRTPVVGEDRVDAVFDHRRAVGFERVYGLPPKIRVARWKRWFQENRMLSSLDCWILLGAKPRVEVRDIWCSTVGVQYSAVQCSTV